MPDFSAAARQVYTNFSVSLRDFTGRSATAQLRVGADALGADLDNLRSAIGDASNARVMRQSAGVTDEIINPANALNTVYDEAYSSVEQKMVMIFQSGAGVVQRLYIPAPDASLFLADGETPDLSNATLINIRDNALTTLNAATPNPTYVFVRAYLQGYGKGLRVPLPLAEPGALDEPPALPGE